MLTSISGYLVLTTNYLGVTPRACRRPASPGTSPWAARRAATRAAGAAASPSLACPSPPGSRIYCVKYFYTHHIKYLFCTSGDYLCSAVNGVGHPQHATITLNVLCRFIIVLSSLSTDVFFCVKCRSYIQDILRKDKRKHV